MKNKNAVYEFQLNQYQVIMWDDFHTPPEKTILCTFTDFNEAKSFAIAYSKIYLASRDGVENGAKAGEAPRGKDWGHYMTSFSARGINLSWFSSEKNTTEFCYPTITDIDNVNDYWASKYCSKKNNESREDATFAKSRVFPVRERTRNHEMNKYYKALNFAADLHDGQFRKGTNVPLQTHRAKTLPLLAKYTFQFLLQID